MAKLSAKGNGPELARFEVSGNYPDGIAYCHQYVIFANGKVLKKVYVFASKYTKGHWSVWRMSQQLTEKAKYIGPAAFVEQCTSKGWKRV